MTVTPEDVFKKKVEQSRLDRKTMDEKRLERQRVREQNAEKKLKNENVCDEPKYVEEEVAVVSEFKLSRADEMRFVADAQFSEFKAQEARQIQELMEFEQKKLVDERIAQAARNVAEKKADAELAWKIVQDKWAADRLLREQIASAENAYVPVVSDPPEEEEERPNIVALRQREEEMWALAASKATKEAAEIATESTEQRKQAEKQCLDSAEKQRSVRESSANYLSKELRKNASTLRTVYPGSLVSDLAPKADGLRSSRIASASDTLPLFASSHQPQQPLESSTPHSIGLGIAVSRREGGRIVVERIVPNSPAARCGDGVVAVGSEIVEFDGESLAQMDFHLIQQKFMGPVGHACTLSIISPGGSTAMPYRIIRAPPVARVESSGGGDEGLSHLESLLKATESRLAAEVHHVETLKAEIRSLQVVIERLSTQVDAHGDSSHPVSKIVAESKRDIDTLLLSTLAAPPQLNGILQRLGAAFVDAQNSCEDLEKRIHALKREQERANERHEHSLDEIRILKERDAAHEEKFNTEKKLCDILCDKLEAMRSVTDGMRCRIDGYIQSEVELTSNVALLSHQLSETTSKMAVQEKMLELETQRRIEAEARVRELEARFRIVK